MPTLTPAPSGLKGLNMTTTDHRIVAIDTMETTRNRQTIDARGNAEGLPVAVVTARFHVITCACGSEVTARTLGHTAVAFNDHARYEAAKNTAEVTA